MTVLTFSLSSDAVSRVRDLLICLSRFNETVDMEATSEQLTLSTLNSSRTSFASFVLDRKEFFDAYTFIAPTSGRFSCQFLNKAFFSIFKTRSTDYRDQDTGIERCEVGIYDDEDDTECLLIAKLACLHGVKKTFKLTYEPIEIMYPTFNSKISRNIWAIAAHSLRTLTDHFGPRAEHIDFFHDAGRLLLTGYTEKIARGTEILKQALQTTITVDKLDFENFQVDEHVHIGINAKDFKAIIQHADCLKTIVTATYAQAKQPLQLKYSEIGLHCSFTLVTMSEYLGTTPKIARTIQNKEPTPQTTHRPITQGGAVQDLRMAAKESMPAPAQPASRSFSRDLGSNFMGRPSPPPPQASINQESLFLADDDDEEDRRWQPNDYTEYTDAVRWDSGGDLTSRAHLGAGGIPRQSSPLQSHSANDYEVPPTQRMSQIRGLFDT